MLPVGSLKPNDLGLFDMMGNAMEWCQEEIRYYQPGIRGASEDKEHIGDIKSVNIRNSRVLRGGSFLVRSVFVRSAYRIGNEPAIRYVNIGFRPARTFPGN